MNNINIEKPNSTFIDPSEIVNPILVVRFYQIGYPITFLLGFIGNTASFITFSRVTLRKVSTGCLFMILAISDSLYLLLCVIDFVQFGLQIRFYGHVKYDELCRFRSFVMNVSQVISSWILVTISVDRWIRTRFPYKSTFWCTPKKALIVVGILLVIDAGIHAHMLTPLYGMSIPDFANLACGPTLLSGSYSNFFLYYWSIVQILVISLIPVTLMFLILMDISINVRIRKRAVIQPAQTHTDNNKTNQQRNLQLQMFILMLTSSCIFLVTTLPLALYKIISPRESNFTLSVFRITSIWTGLGWFQSLNYAVNFYVHCLTSTLFRKEFKLQMDIICCVNQTRVETFNLNEIVTHAKHARK